MKRIRLLALAVLVVAMAMPGLAGRHYDAPPFLDELLERVEQATQDAQNAEAELRELEEHIRDRADWFRNHPADRDRMRNKNIQLERTVRQLWEKRRCAGSVYDGAKADYMRIAHEGNPFVKAAQLATWEATWRDRSDGCGR